MTKQYSPRDAAALDRVRDIISRNGCDCECGCPVGEHDGCEECLACRISDVVSHESCPNPLAELVLNGSVGTHNGRSLHSNGLTVLSSHAATHMAHALTNVPPGPVRIRIIVEPREPA